MPLPAQIHTTAFRETNVGQDKTLDNSVLWSSFKSLTSVIQSLNKSGYDRLLSDLPIGVERAVIEGNDPIQHLIDTFCMLVNQLNYRHLVVVIDANLWITKDNDIAPVNWCRFIQHHPYGYALQWFDVVNLNHFSEYAKHLTSYYESEMEKFGT